jgi:hypothetical protein
MGSDDAFSVEMPMPPPDPIAPHDDTVERLLTGRLVPEEAPAAYAEVARLLEAVAGPPRPDELAGQAAVMAAFRARHRRAGRGRRVRLVAVTVAGAVFAGGAAAASTGSLPAPVERVVRTLRGDAAPAGDPVHRQPLRPAPATSGPLTGNRTAAPSPGAPSAGHAGPTATYDAKPGKRKQSKSKQKQKPVKPAKPRPGKAT